MSIQKQKVVLMQFTVPFHNEPLRKSFRKVFFGKGLGPFAKWDCNAAPLIDPFPPSPNHVTRLLSSDRLGARQGDQRWHPWPRPESGSRGRLPYLLLWRKSYWTMDFFTFSFLYFADFPSRPAFDFALLSCFRLLPYWRFEKDILLSRLR